MRRTIQTTYRYRLDPTAEQVNRLNQFAGARRFVWNWALGRKRDHFRQTGKTLSYNDLAAELTRLKQQPATAWLREMDSQSLQQALRDLDSAYQHLAQRAPPPRATSIVKDCACLNRSSRQAMPRRKTPVETR